MQDIIIVNASTLLHDNDVMNVIPPMQKQADRDFLPIWGNRVVHPINIHFARMRDIPTLPLSAWPIFLNRHSKEAGALGWHDDAAGRIYSRVFVGDCIRFGLDWTITLSHELLEMILDPNIRRVWRMPNGELAALEACDPVEADRLGYFIDGVRVSDFVYPAYFSTNARGPFDYRHALSGPCPDLTSGGYQSITKNGHWTQIYANLTDGIPSARALKNGHRRMSRGLYISDQVEVLA